MSSNDDDSFYDGVVKVAVISVVSVTMILGLVWISQGNDFFMYKVFAPKMEEVRRKTFEESKAFNDGMIQDLSRDQIEFIHSTPVQQHVMASTILHQYAGFDESKLPPNLQEFLHQLKQLQGISP